MYGGYFDMKKIICVFLALIIAVSCASGVYGIAVGRGGATNLPTMYISGQGADLRAADSNGRWTANKIFPPEYDVNEILDSVNLLHKPFAKGVMTGNWDDWCDTFVDIIVPLFEQFAMDENGNTVTPVYYGETNISKDFRDENGKIDIATYFYQYDWRADPVESTVRLNNYIKRLLNKQKNYKKVNIVGRCIGGNVLLSYLSNYDVSNINSVAFYCEGFEGFEIIGKLFTGDVSIDAAALSRFADDYLSDGEYRDDELYEMLTDLISILNTMKTLGVAVDTFDNIYDKVYANVVPRILRKSFGLMPSFWGLVGDKYYEDAKKFVFGDEIDTTYAELVKKIDNFHYNYLLRYEEIVNNAVDRGVKVYNVTKYGLQIFPTGGDSFIQSDTILETFSASGGATCCGINAKFTDEYLSSADPRYISADKQIDASACLLPEHTWFIKNNSHMYMPGEADKMISYILDSEDYLSAPDCDKYPQYMFFVKDTEELVPLTEENGDTFKKPGFFARLRSFFKHLFSIISDFINKKIEEIKAEKNPPATE